MRATLRSSQSRVSPSRRGYRLDGSGSLQDFPYIPDNAVTLPSSSSISHFGDIASETITSTAELTTLSRIGTSSATTLNDNDSKYDAMVKELSTRSLT